MRLRIQRNQEGRRELVLKRTDAEPLEGTRIDLFTNQIIPWWNNNGLTNSNTWMPAGPYLAEQVWVANRCIQLNSQQIASMPLDFKGSDRPPAWLTSPDPAWYPNGIGDVVKSMVAQYYSSGFTCQYVTDYYNTGFPRTWTVLDSCALNIKIEDGRRVYKYGETLLDASRVIQIDRNPLPGRAKGTPALSAFPQVAWGLLAAQNQSMTVNQGGIPPAVIKAQKKITKEQAEAVQTQWMERTQARNGAPPVLPPDLDFQTLTFNPADMALIETQEFNAKALMSAFGVPAVMLNQVLQGGLAYQSPAQLAEQWIWFELQPTALSIANALSAQMLPAGQSVSFNVETAFVPVGPTTSNEPQASQVAKASPTQQQSGRLTAIGGGG